VCVCVCVCVCHSEYLVPAHVMLYCVCVCVPYTRFAASTGQCLHCSGRLFRKTGTAVGCATEQFPTLHDTFLSRGARYLCLFWWNCLPPANTLCIVRHVVTSLCILSFFRSLRTVPEPSVHTVSYVSSYVKHRVHASLFASEADITRCGIK